MSHGGNVLKFIGDGTLAMRAEDHLHACNAAYPGDFSA